MRLSFEWLIDPIKPETFFKDYYERKPLLIARDEPGRFERLLSIGSIDRFLATTSASYPDVFLVDAARPLNSEDYTLATPQQEGRLNLARVYELFRSGATISIRHLHEEESGLAALCRAVEKAFSGPFQTNIYLSPPRAQGFKTHFDSHDVFVLQVAGSKVWTLNDTLIELPLHGQKFISDKHIPGPPNQEFTIRAGDLFYCPRGLFHSARSTDEVSLHITLGLIGRTWADVMAAAISAACVASPAFRANLPVGYANADFNPARATETFRSLIEVFSRTADLRPILEQFAEEFVTSRRPDLTGGLQELTVASPVGLETTVEPRPDLIYRIREMQEKVELLFGPTTITFPAAVRDTLLFALRGQPFAVRDLPGRLDDPGKIVLVSRLIREGLLVRTPGRVGRTVAQP